MAMAETRATAAVRLLAAALATHRCSACAGHDDHAACEQPPWDLIARRMRAVLDDEEA